VFRHFCGDLALTSGVSAIVLVLRLRGARWMVLFLFVVMMSILNLESLRMAFTRSPGVGWLTALALFSRSGCDLRSRLGDGRHEGPGRPPADYSNTRALGQCSYTKYSIRSNRGLPSAGCALAAIPLRSAIVPGTRCRTSRSRVRNGLPTIIFKKILIKNIKDKKKSVRENGGGEAAHDYSGSYLTRRKPVLAVGGGFSDRKTVILAADVHELLLLAAQLLSSPSRVTGRPIHGQVFVFLRAHRGRRGVAIGLAILVVLSASDVHHVEA